MPTTPDEISKAVNQANQSDEGKSLTRTSEEKLTTSKNFKTLQTIFETVQIGADSFLKAQYTLCAIFTVLFSIVVFILTSAPQTCNPVTGQAVPSLPWNWTSGALTAFAFIVGAVTSIISGWIGMTVAVFSNGRVTVEASKMPDALGWRGAFNAAFIAGSVMGYLLVALALLVLFILIKAYQMQYSLDSIADAKHLFECIAGYGLGGSCMALFGRVGGGIFTKAADVGADLSGKVAGIKNNGEMYFLDEDSPLNPATIADNVGDNVGDVAGMGSDLFGSFAEASCAALVISASSPEILSAGGAAFMFPLAVSGMGIIMCMLCSFIATHIQTVAKHTDVECVLKVQLFSSALAMTFGSLVMAKVFLPDKFAFDDLHDMTNPAVYQTCTWIQAWVCIVCGLWGGCLIGFITEYYTSHSYVPVQEVSQSCESGAATNIIYGLALGYLSCRLPIAILSVNVYVAFSLCGMYGVALAALGMLGTLATCLSIDVYGPISDNAGGLAEMAEFPPYVRVKTDALDAAGNTTAAIGKGFAIGSAALVSLALFGGFVSRIQVYSALPVEINILRPITFAFLFFGAMVPYWFTAYCMKSVGAAASQMVANVKKQFSQAGDNVKIRENSAGHKELYIVEGANFPNYQECIEISTNASLREMVPPALLVIFSPLITGALFGVEAVSGLLVGSLISAVQLAISQSNSGGAWDNAKKYVEGGNVCQLMTLTQEHCNKLSDGPTIFNVIRNEDGTTSKGLAATNPHSFIGQDMYVAQGKKTDMHKAAVVGDTVGDPLKDTSGPALNIVMKLMAILSLVFSDFFVSINHGQGAFNLASTVHLDTIQPSGC